MESIEATEKKENDGKIHLRKGGYLKSYDPVPELEWWDATFLPPVHPDQEVEPQRRFPYPDLNPDTDIYLEKITHYIQHPKTLRNELVDKVADMVIPIHLTDKEKKRLRRMKRLDKEKDKQEKVKLGLLPVPPPKVKLSNYMKIMGKEAIADPSRVEQKVRSIIDKRLHDHLDKNESNKLTRE